VEMGGGVVGRFSWYRFWYRSTIGGSSWMDAEGRRKVSLRGLDDSYE